MIKKFSSPKIEYQLVTERSEANQNSLTFPTWCPCEESNLDLRFRKPVLYPLSYRGLGHGRLKFQSPCEFIGNLFAAIRVLGYMFTQNFSHLLRVSATQLESDKSI